MGMISSLLVFQLGQARVRFAMSRDGLLPKLFSRVHAHNEFPISPHGSQVSWWEFLPGCGHRNADGSFEYWDPVRVRLGCSRCADSAIQAARVPSRISCAGRLDRADPTILTCVLSMAGLPIVSWIRFFLWLTIGLCLYYFYGRRHSQLATPKPGEPSQEGKSSNAVAVSLALMLMLVISCLSPPSSFAWGENAQRLITNKAVETLPNEIRPFFERTANFCCYTRQIQRKPRKEIRRSRISISSSSTTTGNFLFPIFRVRTRQPYRNLAGDRFTTMECFRGKWEPTAKS